MNILIEYIILFFGDNFLFEFFINNFVILFAVIIYSLFLLKYDSKTLYYFF